ncbi:uncharacterized protein [Panulirus ornatus]
MDEHAGSGGLMTDAGISLQLASLYPGLYPSMTPTLEFYMDTQPIDFSTKKIKTSPVVYCSDHSDSDRCSLTEDGPGAAINLVLDRKLWSRSSESGVSVSSASPERAGSPRSTCDSPMVVSPGRHPHHHAPPLHQQPPTHFNHTPITPPTTATFNSALLAQLHTNPILYSSLQSAINQSKMAAHPFRSPVNHSPPTAADFVTPPVSVHPSSNPAHPLTAGSPRLPGLTGSGLGAGGLGLGAGGLISNGVQGLPSLSSSGLSPFDGMGKSADGIADVGNIGSGATSLLSGTQEEAAINAESNDAYAKFRAQMLAQVTASKARRNSQSRKLSQSSNIDNRIIHEDKPDYGDSKNDENDACGSLSDGGGSVEAREATDGDDGDTQSSGTISNGAKRRGRQNGDTVKDEAYWERRRKNNEAAKRSRDARRAKEDEIAIRAAFLEQENLKLRVEVASLKSETAKLRCMLYNS